MWVEAWSRNTGVPLLPLKVDDAGINGCGIVQQVVVLVLEVFVEERNHAGSDRPALLPGNGGWIRRPGLFANERAPILKTLMAGILNLKPEGMVDRVGEKDQGSI